MGRRNALNATAAVRKPLSLKQPRASQADFGKVKLQDKLAKLADKENIPANANQPKLAATAKGQHTKHIQEGVVDPVGDVDRLELRKRVEAAVALHLAAREKVCAPSAQMADSDAPKLKQDRADVVPPKRGTSLGSIMSVVLVVLVLLWSAARVVVLHPELLPLSQPRSLATTPTVPSSIGMEQAYASATPAVHQFVSDPPMVQGEEEDMPMPELTSPTPISADEQEAPSMQDMSSRETEQPAEEEQPSAPAPVPPLPVAQVRPKLGAAHQLQAALTSVRRMFAPLRAMAQKLQQASQEWARRTMLAFRFAIDRFR
jgi:hypothetical protein